MLFSLSLATVVSRHLLLSCFLDEVSIFVIAQLKKAVGLRQRFHPLTNWWSSRTYCSRHILVVVVNYLRFHGLWSIQYDFWILCSCQLGCHASNLQKWDYLFTNVFVCIWFPRSYVSRWVVLATSQFEDFV